MGKQSEGGGEGGGAGGATQGVHYVNSQKDVEEEGGYTEGTLWANNQKEVEEEASARDDLSSESPSFLGSLLVIRGEVVVLCRSSSRTSCVEEEGCGFVEEEGCVTTRRVSQRRRLSTHEAELA